ncbi:MAG TPA: hypothetical protein VGV16_04870 [Gammaproteobacteria bacterium]|nr:hypothetical protein [Gammaproteobacteria bacterium]
MRSFLTVLSALALFALTAPDASACACGCGVFSVGTSALLPNGAGATAFLEYDYMNQSQNWSGSSSAPAANNADKDIRTDFYTAGLQYMFDRDWGLMAEIPYWDRLFVTTLDDGSIGGFHHSALGDIRLRGVYTGFSDDMSTGIIFGLKLPTGDYTYPNFDRDTSIGSGSTDSILGVYHESALDADNTWTWFAQGQWERAFKSRDGYRPGNELDAAAGVYYGGWQLGAQSTLAPVLQLLASDRWRDSGPLASTAGSGYQRLLAAPGLEFDTGKLRLYADVELPLYQDVNGNQLVAPRLYKFIVAYSF